MTKKFVRRKPSYITLIRIYDRLYKFYGPQDWWPGDTCLEIITGAILTQNTAWANVEKAISNLKKAKAFSSFKKISGINIKKLKSLIRPAGYYNIKARRLKNFMNFLKSGYSGSLGKFSRRKTSEMRFELLGVNGIGPETRDSIMLYAFNRPVFVVDAYTRRIFSRHGLIKADASYDEVQRLFMDNLPKDARLFNEYHALIVRVGKEFCRAKAKCNGCPLKNFMII